MASGKLVINNLKLSTINQTINFLSIVFFSISLPGGIHQPSFVQIISFSMTNKSCEDKGWIVQAEEAQQEEQRSLLGLLLERLRETLRKV